MERKIGEIFEYNGEWYQCVEDSIDNCVNCCFYNGGHKKCSDKMGECFKGRRSDNNGVYFKKLEKVGEPYKYYIKCVEGVDFIIVQEYILPNPSYIWNDEENVFTRDCYNGRIAIEIKQTKEDMEETNFIEKLETLCKRYNMPDGVRTDFISEVKEIIKDKEECNFKPFNLKAAKAGKPVCTRYGRKARIICFDRRLFYKNVSYPILALVECSDGEDDVCGYNEKGKVLIEDGAEYKDDLMMLPEKKEGWVNVYKGGLLDTKSYPTKKEAFDKACPEGYVDTVKVCWEE